MTHIEFYGSKLTADIPSSWEEMTAEQVRHVFRLYDDSIQKEESPLTFSIRVLYYFMGIKPSRKYIKMTYKQPLEAEKICENTYTLCEACLGFLFDKEGDDGNARLSYDSIKNPLPAVRSSKFSPLLTGPADLLIDLTFGEYRHASAALNTFFRTHDVADLDECITILYRPRCKKANKAGRTVIPISHSTFSKDVARVASIPTWQKNLIMMWFAACIKYLQSGQLEIDGETVDFSQLYSGSLDRQEEFSYNMNDLLVQLSRDGVIGNMDAVDEEPLMKIFGIMWTNFKESKNHEKQTNQ